MQAAEMRFLLAVNGCTLLDMRPNTDIREELQIFSIEERVIDYKRQWKGHVERMEYQRLLKRVM